jgi:anti-sigma regulatory factor (Ser/Thr protein kinase)/CHASE3 domain sensor protein
MAGSVDRNRLQLLLAGIVPLAFLLLLSAISADLVWRAEHVAARARNSAVLVAQASSLADALITSDRGLSDYTLGRKRSGLREYQDGLNAVPTRSAKLLAMVPKSSPNRTNALRYVALSTAAIRVLKNYFGYVRKGDMAAARSYAQSKTVQQLGKALASARTAFEEGEQRETITLFDRFLKNLRLYSEALLLICVLGVTGTFLAAGGLGRFAQRLRESFKEKKELQAAYERAHHVASTLQRALLPRALPETPGLHIDASYVPAAKGAEIGGDWYDVFVLSEHVIAIGIGDVEGHDLYAATVMGSVRQAIRITARDDPDPAAVLERVNKQLYAEGERRAVSAFLATLDIDDGTLRYATAGHPAPILMRSDLSTSSLECSGLMLGVNPRAQFLTFETKLEAGCALVLYTDGLVEVNRDYISGVNQLESVVRTTVSSGGDNIAGSIQDRMFSGLEPGDDSAVLFVGVTELGERLMPAQSRRWSVDAKDEASAHRAKRAVLLQLGEFVASSADFETIEAIVGELMSNVARHTPGEAEIALELGRQGVRLSVRDRGAPFDHRGEHAPEFLAEGGRGLFIVRALASNLRVERTPEGNCVSVFLPIPLNVPTVAISAA